MLFVQQIEAMYEAGARVFIEAGPGQVLTDLVSKILKGKPHVAVACDKNDGAGLASFLNALAKLAAAGVSRGCNRALPRVAPRRSRSVAASELQSAAHRVARRMARTCGRCMAIRRISR